MGGNNRIGGLGSLLALAALAASVRTPRRDGGGPKSEDLMEGFVGLTEQQIDEMLLAATPFQSMPATAQEQWGIAIQELMELDADSIHGCFLTVLVKSPAGEFCKACDTVHDRDGLKQLITAIGPIDDVSLITRTGQGYFHDRVQSVDDQQGGITLRGHVTLSPKNDEAAPVAAAQEEVKTH